MKTKRFAIAIIACVVAGAFGIAPSAHASASRDCLNVLISDRFNAVDDLFSANHFLIRDTTAFLDSAIDDDTVSELNADYNRSARDLLLDLRTGRRDIISDRKIAVEDMTSGRCSGISHRRVRRELRFYRSLLRRLNVAYLQARASLDNAYQAGLATFG